MQNLLNYMQNIQEIFHKNYSLWNQKQINLIEDLFLNNKHVSQFYQNKKFNSIAKICLYRKLQPGEKLLLQHNNRPQIIILLSGNIKISKKQRKMRKKPRISLNQQSSLQNSKYSPKKQNKNHKKQEQETFQYTFLTQLTQFNESIRLNSQCILQSPENQSSQFLFIPCSLYFQLQEDIENQRVQKIQNVLRKFFFKLKKKELHQLSKCNCIFREFKMNHYIYRATSKPEEIFVLLEGMVKLQKPGFSQETLKQTILISSGRIFGENDLKLQQRTRNAVACSSHVQVLTIPKNQFLKYSQRAFPNIIYQQSERISPTKLPSLNQPDLKLSHSLKLTPQRKSFLPYVGKRHFHRSGFEIQSKKSESQQKRQYQLMKNAHMLVDLKQKPKKKHELIRNFSPKSIQQKHELFKMQKNKLKQLRIQSSFSLDNSLINL